MDVKFGVYETPQPLSREGKQKNHARVITTGTRRIEEMCDFISDCTSLSSADVKGVLEALTKYVGLELRSGAKVELEGLGYFSLSTKSTQTTTAKGKPTVTVVVDGVNFRCSTRLKKDVKRTRLVKIGEKKMQYPELEERKKRMVDYINKHGYINASLYAALNDCSRYRASAELKQFAVDKIIGCLGRSTHLTYQFIDEKE